MLDSGTIPKAGCMQVCAFRGHSSARVGRECGRELNEFVPDLLKKTIKISKSRRITTKLTKGDKEAVISTVVEILYKIT
jgi:hypothetical protein